MERGQIGTLFSNNIVVGDSTVIYFFLQVVTSKLSAMDELIHKILDVEAGLNSSPNHTHHTSTLSFLINNLTQVNMSFV